MTIKGKFANNILGPSDVFKAGRDMPPGSIRWHMDCSADPLNILAPAQMIVAAIKQRMAELQPGQKLAVLMGENHTMPTHNLLPQMVMQLLRADPKTSNFVYLMELPYNFWSQVVNTVMKVKLPEELEFATGASDLIDQANQMSLRGFECTPNAPNTLFHTMRWIAHQGIRVRFNDVSRDYFWLQQKDMLIQSLCKENRITESIREIKLNSPQGIRIRNHFMAVLGVEFAQAHSADVIIQSTGLDHALGNCFERFAFEHSLAKTYGQRDIDTIPVFLTTDITKLHISKGGKTYKMGMNILEPEAIRFLQKKGVVIDGIKKVKFSTDEDVDQEFDYLRSINAASGNMLELTDDLEKEVPENKNRAKELILRIIDEYNCNNPESPTASTGPSP
jgi:hypothetical protein